jgi:hypothetical protein
LAILADDAPTYSATSPVETPETSETFPANPGGRVSTVSTVSTRGLSADFEERAAIIEEGAQVPREWADAYARILDEPAPPYFDPNDWASTLDACGRFLDQWAVTATRLGWTADELFGWGRGRRPDNRGAAFLLSRDVDVIAITATEITVRIGRVPRRLTKASRANVGPAWALDNGELSNGVAR